MTQENPCSPPLVVIDGEAVPFRETLMPSADDLTRHPVTGRFLAFNCEVDCLEHCAGLCGNF